MKRKLFIFSLIAIFFVCIFTLTAPSALAAEKTDEEKVVEEINNISVPQTAIIDFPVVYVSAYGSTIEWKSSNTQYLNVPQNGGWVDVTRPTDANVEVTLTVTITLGEASKSKEFKVTVLKGTTLTNTYKLEYELNGGTNNSANPSTYKVASDVELLAPTKVGYKFDGWYDNEKFEGEEITSLPKGLSGDYKVYAKWVELEVQGIQVKTAPNKTVYNAKENFDSTGLVVELVYAGGATEEIPASKLSFNKTDLHYGDEVVTVSYENYSAEIKVTVNKLKYDLSEVEFKDTTVVYNGEEQSIAVPTNLPKGLTAAVDTKVKDVTEAPVLVKLVFTNTDEDYETPEALEAKLTITKALAEVIIGNQTITAGENLPEFTYTVKGLIGQDQLEGTFKPVHSVTSTETPGSYEISGEGLTSKNYEIKYTAGTLTINEKQASKIEIVVDEKELSKVYNGQNQMFQATVTVDGQTVENAKVNFANQDGSDFTGATDAGEYTVVLTYETATLTVKFVISAKELTVDMFEKLDDVKYNGEAHTPEVKGSFNQTSLVKDTDFKVNYTNNVEAGIAEVVVEGLKNFGGKVTLTFNIVLDDLDKVKEAKEELEGNYKTTELPDQFETEATNGAKVQWFSTSTALGINNETGAITMIQIEKEQVVLVYALIIVNDSIEYASFEFIVPAKEESEDPVTPTVTEGSVVFEDAGYENAQELTAVELSNATLTFDKGTNSNTPKYYNTGAAARLYGGNTLTITPKSSATYSTRAVSTGVKIVEVILTFGTGDGTNEISTSAGTYADGVITISEGAEVVVITIGGSSGHRRIASITVKCESASTDQPDTPVVPSDKELLEEAASAITLPAETEADLTLPTTGENNVTIAWSSSNESAITNAGKVTRSEEDVTVTLTATLTLNQESKELTFEVKVLKEEKQEEETFPLENTDYNLYIEQDNLSKTLYSTGLNSGNYGATTESVVEAAVFNVQKTTDGYYIYSKTTNKYLNVIQSGTYINVSFGATASTVWTYNSEYDTMTTLFNEKTYYVGTYNTYATLSASDISYAATSFPSHLTPAKEITDEDYLQAAYDALTIANQATADIELPLTGDYDTTITWASNNESVITSAGKVTRGTSDATVTLTATIKLGTLTKTKSFEVVVPKEVEEGEEGVLATFEFGANGEASHSDGSELKADTTYTEGDYSLTLTGMSKVYGGARDLLGNSCLKLGTSSVGATLTFTVPANVTQVKILVAGYKAKTVSVTINGGSAIAVSKSSNNGEYQEIIVDTTSNKTITFATTTNYRAMINSITYIGTSSSSGSGSTEVCEHTYSNGTCSKCGETCTHVYENGVCTICSLACSHSYVNGICGTCGEADPNYTAPETQSYTLVTDLSQLSNGSKIVLYASNLQAAMGTNGGSYNASIATTETGKTDATVSPSSDLVVITLELVSDNTYYLSTSQGYLYAKNENKLYVGTDKSDAYKWIFAITDGVLTIQNASFTDRYIEYNKNSGQERFAAYKGTQQEISAYVAGN